MRNQLRVTPIKFNACYAPTFCKFWIINFNGNAMFANLRVSEYYRHRPGIVGLAEMNGSSHTHTYIYNKKKTSICAIVKSILFLFLEYFAANVWLILEMFVSKSGPTFTKKIVHMIGYIFWIIYNFSINIELWQT